MDRWVKGDIMPNESDYRAVGKQITDYADAVLAVNVLTQKLKGQAISVQVGEKLIEYHNAQTPPNIVALIDDLVNSKKMATPGQEMIVVVGADAYQVTVKATDDNKTDVQITKKLVQNDNKQLELQTEDRPIVSIMRNTGGFEAKVNGKVVFTEKSPAPKPLQRGVIEQFGVQVSEGNPQQLAIMGTGTGKSWVIAGIAHATAATVMIVPDDDLFKEMKHDAIKTLHGNDAAANVHSSKEYQTIPEFEEAIKQGVMMILVADDPLFNKKSATIKDKIILMDESHQHTFTEASRQTLTSLRNNNMLFALTGTPTSKLISIIGREPMMDVNVRSVMDSGELRQNYRQTNAEIPPEDLVKTTVTGYFARDEYLTRGPGVTSIHDIKSSIREGQPESEVIDNAILKNRERGLTHKNFVFSGDATLRAKILESYEHIAKGTYPDIEALQTAVANDRREKEINARAAIIHELHKERPMEAITAEVRAQIGNIPIHVDLQAEIAHAQQQQIADSINATALALVYNATAVARKAEKLPVNSGNFEKAIRMQTLDNELKELKEKPAEPSKASIDEVYPGLRGEQGDIFRKKVAEVAERLAHAEPGSPPPLCTAKDIDLQAMQTSYTASASKNSTKKAESEQMLDQLRTGLVMHVASDNKYTTGISIKSVLSVQQVVTHDEDILNNAVDAPQLHGRNIRDKDRGAFNQQVVSNVVKHCVSLESIYSKTSGKEMDEFFKYEEAHKHEVKVQRKVAMLEGLAQVSPKKKSPKKERELLERAVSNFAEDLLNHEAEAQYHALNRTPTEVDFTESAPATRPASPEQPPTKPASPVAASPNAVTNIQSFKSVKKAVEAMKTTAQEQEQVHSPSSTSPK